VPAVFTYIDDFEHFLKRLRAKRQAKEAHVAPSISSAVK
jgi:hypothetical protein